MRNLKKVLIIGLSLLMVGCVKVGSKTNELEKKETGTPEVAETVALENEAVIESFKEVYGAEFDFAWQKQVVNSELPFFELTDINGNKVSSEDFKDKKVIIEVIADWCPYCMEVTKGDIIKELDEDVTFIQVFGSGDKTAIEEFYKSAEVEMPSNIVIIPESEQTLAFLVNMKVEAYPTFYLVDKNVIKWGHVGLADNQMIDYMKDKVGM